ncbi:MAG: type II secretion system F family protein [Candidatus Omnitrophica bacterium]|nr:type II secretion system F family protein [Candidatus Omnitrophota bacterium]MDD5477074.1 type II secretion system F family protein [Candidatus Omnitrophota bacterium]
MIKYIYHAKKNTGETVEGRIDAVSKEEAIEKLSLKGYLPISIEEDPRRIDHQAAPNINRQASRMAESKIYFFSKPGAKIKSGQITVFSRQLASLLKSGVPILSAINIISEQSENLYLKVSLKSICNAVKDGSTFSSALSNYPRIFSSLYVALVRSGEESGTLPAALLRIADYRAKQEEIISRIRMSLAYPILMAIVGAGTIVFMLTFVMPRLMGIFVNLGEKLPLPTRILISISQGLGHWWFWIILALAIIILLIRRQVKTEAGKLSFSLFKLHLPVFGKLILKAELARFSRTLELLIKNGISILRAIDVAVPVLENEIIKKQLRQSYKELEQGGFFGRSLKNSKVFPPFMSNLISIGEESGRLDEALAEIADTYEHDTDEAIKVMSSLIEPLMILGMGLIVGFIVVAMLLPVFEINVIAR